MSVAGMGQEDDRNKPPDAVQTRVITEGWYLVQVDRDRLQMGLYVGLVACQIEPIAEVGSEGRERLQRHRVQGREETGVIALCYPSEFNRAGSRAGQHGLHPFAKFLLPFPMLDHLLPEIGGIEGEAIEEEL